MAMVVLDEKGVTCEFFARGTTVNSDHYIETLRNLLSLSHKQMSEVLLLHDSTRPHTSAQTTDAIAKSGWRVLLHQPYSPDVTTSDFYLFGPLKDSLGGQDTEERYVLLTAEERGQLSLGRNTGFCSKVEEIC
jgi:hypothetical protein